jgi:hypothetical protein
MITKKYHYNSNGVLIISCDIILYKYRIKKVTVKIIESLRFFITSANTIKVKTLT